MGDLVLEKHLKKESPWIKYIKQRVYKKNKNFLGFFSGPTGGGKSWSALKIASLLKRDFGVDCVVFKGKNFIKLINSFKKSRGQVIIFDEAGVDLSNRAWQSLTNKILNYLLQTFRHQGIIVLFTSPYMDFIDAASRKLFHAEFQLRSINKKEKYAVIKPYLIQYNGRKKKFYYKYLRMATKGYGLPRPIKKWKVGIPLKKLREDYEAKRLKFTLGLNKEIEEAFKKLGKTRVEDLPLRQRQIIQDYWMVGIFNQVEIAKGMEISQPVVCLSEQRLEKKGHKKDVYRQKYGNS